jgi:hypothetical protein
MIMDAMIMDAMIMDATILDATILESGRLALPVLLAGKTMPRSTGKPGRAGHQGPTLERAASKSA